MNGFSMPGYDYPYYEEEDDDSRDDYLEDKAEARRQDWAE